MTSLNTFSRINISQILVKSLLLAVVMFSFSSCEDGLDNMYPNPCATTEEEKQAQLALDVDSIGDYFFNNNIDTSAMQKTASGIHYTNLSAGTGDVLKKGDKVLVHYVGKFLDGSTFEASTTFDNSYNSNRPVKVVIGGPTQAQQVEGFIPVIEGWNEALALMKVGEETRFYLPSYLAYGKCGSASIPPNAVLAFDMKVVQKF